MTKTSRSTPATPEGEIHNPLEREFCWRCGAFWQPPDLDGAMRIIDDIRANHPPIYFWSAEERALLRKALPPGAAFLAVFADSSRFRRPDGTLFDVNRMGQITEVK
jgi:hypothetical protein